MLSISIAFLSHSDSYSLVAYSGLVYSVSKRGATPHLSFTIFVRIIKQLLVHFNMVTLDIRANIYTSFTKEHVTRANEVRRFHYAFLHLSNNILFNIIYSIQALKYGLLMAKGQLYKMCSCTVVVMASAYAA